MASVPIVDIGNPSATSLAALDDACRSHGFFLLEGHGLGETIDETFRVGRQFFDGDPAVKNSVRRDERVALGYNDRELTKRQRDHKEVFDFVDPTEGRAAHHNRWPSAPDGFRATMARHFDAFSELAARTTALVFEALAASRSSVEDHRGDRTTSYMRLNRYTVGDPVPEHKRAGLTDLDVLVVPALAFDRTGGRLGHGGGHYDRMLGSWAGLKVGISFDFQVFDVVPMGSQDIPVDMVITEKATYAAGT